MLSLKSFRIHLIVFFINFINPICAHYIPLIFSPPNPQIFANSPNESPHFPCLQTLIPQNPSDLSGSIKTIIFDQKQRGYLHELNGLLRLALYSLERFKELHILNYNTKKYIESFSYALMEYHKKIRQLISQQYVQSEDKIKKGYFQSYLNRTIKAMTIYFMLQKNSISQKLELIQKEFHFIIDREKLDLPMNRAYAIFKIYELLLEIQKLKESDLKNLVEQKLPDLARAQIAKEFENKLFKRRENYFGETQDGLFLK